ncbi:MAG: addiction module protein [Gemmatimonadaceae bacterium]
MAHPEIDFSHLAAEERIQLAEDLWDSLATMPEDVAMPEAHARD